MVEEVALRLGSVDILVNNAGITRDNLIHKMSEDDWDAVAGVHLRARSCARARRSARWSSATGGGSSTCRRCRRWAIAARPITRPPRPGLQGMAKTLAIELGRYGITANAVAPGFIDSEMTRATAIRLGRDPEEWKEERAREIPVRRAGVPRDVANLIAFLCSDEASFISGQVIYIAGGPRA